MEGAIWRDDLVRHRFAVRVAIDLDVVEIAFIVREHDDLDRFAVHKAEVRFEDGTVATGKDLVFWWHEWLHPVAFLDTNAKAIAPARAKLFEDGVRKLVSKQRWRGVFPSLPDEVHPKRGAI